MVELGEHRPASSASARHHEMLDCRSFWRAGNYEVNTSLVPSLQGTLESSDFDRARVHPKFLHSNATSHKWAFGAIAELLDNAVDEISSGAKFVKIDKMINPRDNSPMLLVQDDGGGMDPEGIRHCMSLGFSKKNSKTTIGQYGNGFKTSTMRLGADAIVFTRSKRDSYDTQSIGLLSYTFLRRTMKDDIIVPMIDFRGYEKKMQPLVYSSQNDWDDSLSIILEWSPFSSKRELMRQFEDVGSHGTKVLVYNLWMNDSGLLELDFEDNDEDICLRDRSSSEEFSRHKEVVQTHLSHTLRFSLRAYSSILYLRKFTNFEIILRGKPVEQVNITDEMKFKEVKTYKPQTRLGSEEAVAKTTIGFAKEAPVLGIFGINVYHKNRLIMPFWKVLQEGSSRGRCVVGVIEANFIEPAHDKQDFERTPMFIRLETKLRQVILDYWKSHCHLIGYQGNTPQSGQSKDDAKNSPGLRKTSQQKLSGHVPTFSSPARHGLQMEEREGEQQIALPILTGSPAMPFVQDHASGSLIEDASDFTEDHAEDQTFDEKLSEENLQLFSRCEQLQSRRAELKQTVEGLERELDRAKRRCARISNELEARRKQQRNPDLVINIP